MGQCISRGQTGPYRFSRHYDAESLASSIGNGGLRHTWGVDFKERRPGRGVSSWRELMEEGMDDCSNILYDDESEENSDMGHSGSKGSKKRDKSAGSNGNKLTRGVATSFGFRRRPASSSRADDNARKRQQAQDSNGNGGSSEDIHVEDVLSGRSTPLARPRKEAAGQPLRTNRRSHSASRFGFRQGTSNKTAKVGDVNVTAEQAFNVTKDKETAINNNGYEKKNIRFSDDYPIATQVLTTGTSTIVGAAGLPKSVTRQTIILTYQTQQHSALDGQLKLPQRGDRSSSVPRVPLQNQEPQKTASKFTLQTNQLPRTQYPSVKIIDSKAAKQVANNAKKASSNCEEWRGGSAVSTDSGVWTGGEGADGSPRSRRRPRNLEMVMKGSHNFHLRELQVADLDIMDEAVITEHAVIPLPKLPSLFHGDSSPEYENDPAPTYQPPTPVTPINVMPFVPEPAHRSPMSTLEKYRTKTRPSKIQTSLLDYKDEEKFVLDRHEPETFKKQHSFTKSTSGVISPPTVCSSKESSPSCKSEESHFGHSTGDTWQSNAAGEAMATRSQDDVSIALSVSSCEDEKSKQDIKEKQKILEVEIPKKTIIIQDEAPVHPLLMKSITLSQNDSLRGSMMGSMTSSNYSTTSTSTNMSAEAHTLTLTLDEPKFDMSALETSTQSLLDDETSPADSLISSTSTSGSNNDLHMERDAPSLSSSAYQTANTKTKSAELIINEQDGVDGELNIAALEKNPNNVGNDSGGGSKNVSPPTPGTPTHASGSLSLSDGRDYFDDEIADQPALVFRKNTDGSPASKYSDSDGNKVHRSRERIPASPLTQRSRKNGTDRISGPADRTPSLDTLSSLASDDLMMDNDLARSVTSLQSVDDYIERLDSSLRSGLNSLDERQLRQELSSSKCAIRQWSQLLEQNNFLDRQLAAMSQGKSGNNSLTASTSSLVNIGASLPARTARLLQRSRAQTPSETGQSDGSVSPAPANLLQDVVDIKTLLLQLKRVLQEPGAEEHSMSSETLDPLLMCMDTSTRSNGRRPPPASPLHPDACADLRRQILFLQGQLEERDRLVKVLQQQMLKMSSNNNDARADDTCNVATQTDRLRPPMSTNMVNSESSGLVSWNEQANGRKLPTYSEAQRSKKSLTNGTAVKCTCGARQANGLTNGISNGDQDHEATNVQLRTNSRVGSRYLQALATNQNNKIQVKRDTSVSERTVRKSYMYASRSKSIENFQNQNFLTSNSNINNKKIPSDEPVQVKHHTSYGDLYNGRISSRESVNGNRLSPTQNGQSTDTDYSSDGGYKSLPSTINISPKKISGIPRRSIEQKFLSSKHNVKASAV